MVENKEKAAGFHFVSVFQLPSMLILKRMKENSAKDELILEEEPGRDSCNNMPCLEHTLKFERGIIYSLDSQGDA